MLKKQLPAFLLAFVVPLLLVYWWWGGFARVAVVETEAGPYRYAYLDYEGAIDNTRKTQVKALEKFEAARVAAGDTLVVILTDPRSNPQHAVKAQLGYLLAENAAVPEGLREGRLPRRPVLAASVHAAVRLAPGKAYQAVADTEGEAAIRMPTVERYRPAGKASGVGTFTLEIPR